MSPEFWVLLIVGSVFVILASWVALVAQQPSKREPPTLDTRGPDDRPLPEPTLPDPSPPRNPFGY